MQNSIEYIRLSRFSADAKRKMMTIIMFEREI